jgi:hypothetical protein
VGADQREAELAHSMLVLPRNMMEMIFDFDQGIVPGKAV